MYEQMPTDVLRRILRSLSEELEYFWGPDFRFQELKAEIDEVDRVLTKRSA
jgi:hypothetical protein